MPLATEPVRLAADPTTNDVVVPLRLASGVEAVTQGCRDRLMSVRGEWFRDLDLGVPWLENDRVTAAGAILGQRFNGNRARAAVRNALLDDPSGAVAEVLRLDVSFDRTTRVMRIVWQVRATFGDTAVETTEI